MFSRNTAGMPRSSNEEGRQANIRRASDSTDPLNNPCTKEQTQSLKCLEENNYDKEKCQLHFHNYRRCSDFWRIVKLDRRKRGIEPDLPLAEEQEKVKQEYKAKHKLK